MNTTRYRIEGIAPNWEWTDEASHDGEAVVHVLSRMGD